MTRITERDLERLTGQRGKRDSSHEKDAPEAEEMPAHAHSMSVWQRISGELLCCSCQQYFDFIVKLGSWKDGWQCLDCARCPECHKSARQLWEAANKR